MVEGLRSIVNTLRGRKNVVGVWTDVTPGQNTSVTAELENGRGMQMEVSEEGGIVGILRGIVFRKRVNRGRPNVDTKFKTNKGAETMLESREF